MKESEMKRYEDARALHIRIHCLLTALEDINYAINNIDEVTECMLNMKGCISIVDLHPTKDLILKILQAEKKKNEEERDRLQKQFDEL